MYPSDLIHFVQRAFVMLATAATPSEPEASSLLITWATVASAVATAVGVIWAISANLSDRVLRERPFLVFKKSRYVSSKGEPVVDEPALTNLGAGPALDIWLHMVELIHSSQKTSLLLATQPRGSIVSPPLRWRLSSLATNEGISAKELAGHIDIFMKWLRINNPKFFEEMFTDVDIKMRVIIDVVYMDRGRKWYHQTVDIDMYTNLAERPASLADVSLLGADDPLIKQTQADFVGLVIESGALSVINVEMGAQRLIRNIYPPWTRLRRTKREVLRISSNPTGVAKLRRKFVNAFLSFTIKTGKII